MTPDIPASDETLTNHRPLTDLIGLDPNFTGGLSAEEHLRRQRCGECDEALAATEAWEKRYVEMMTQRDQAIGEHAKTQREVSRLSGELETARAVVAAAKAAVTDLLTVHPDIRDAKPGWFHESTLRLVAAVDLLAAPAVVSGTSQAAADGERRQCPNEYIRPGGRQRGDRIVRCHLPAGHTGEHEEAETECTWLNAADAVAGTGQQDTATCGSQYWGGLRQPGNRPILCTLPPHTVGDHAEPETESSWSPKPWQWGSVATSDAMPLTPAAVPAAADNAAGGQDTAGEEQA